MFLKNSIKKEDYNIYLICFMINKLMLKEHLSKYININWVD